MGKTLGTLLPNSVGPQASCFPSWVSVSPSVKWDDGLQVSCTAPEIYCNGWGWSSVLIALPPDFLTSLKYIENVVLDSESNLTLTEPCLSGTPSVPSLSSPFYRWGNRGPSISWLSQGLWTYLLELGREPHVLAPRLLVISFTPITRQILPNSHPTPSGDSCPPSGLHFMSVPPGLGPQHLLFH